MFLICNSLEASIWRETNPRPPLRLPVCRGLQVRRLTLENIGMSLPKKFVEVTRRISPGMKFLSHFQTSFGVWLLGNFSPPNRRIPATSKERQTEVYVASTFGLIAGLLRQSGRSASGVLNSAVFTPIVNLLNSIALDMEHRDAMDFAFGGKAFPVIQASEELYAELAEKSRSIEFLELKLKNPQGQVADLETSLSDFSSSEPTCCSTPVDSRSPSCCSSIEETKCSPDLGSTTKKRQVVGLFIRDFRIRAWHNRPKQKEIYEFFSAFSFTKCSVCL